MRLKIKIISIFIIITIFITLFNATKNELSKKIVIGVQSANLEQTYKAWLPLVEDIGKKLEIKTVLITPTQSDTVYALRYNKADVVWLSSSVAIDAITDANAEPFALYYNVNGTNGYKGLIVTRTDTGIKTIDDALVPGKWNYACLAQTSVSGYVLPSHFLFNPRNTTAEKIYKNVTYGKGHIPNIELLMEKKVDVIACNTTDLAVVQEKNPEAKKNIIILWESPLVPNDMLMYRKDMPEADKKFIKDFFLNVYGKTDEEKELLKKASNIANFVPTTIKILEPVSEFKFATERNAIEQNSNLTAEERTAKLKELDSRVLKFKEEINELK